MTITATFLRARLKQIAAVRHHAWQLWAGRLAATVVVAATSGLVVEAAAAVRDAPPGSFPHKVAVAARLATPEAPAPAPVAVLTWVGRDVDGDGAPDFINPTGHATRVHDAYGYGYFGASRDGGTRDHEGVDFVARPGQTVVAPISGYVTKIGYAYDDNLSLKYVEIANPALRYEARVFYVNPRVAVGEVVRLGAPIGTTHTLQQVYPGGMTDHVHLEITSPRGRRIDASAVIAAELTYRTPHRNG